VKEPVDTVNHIPMVDKLAPVGLLDASLRSRDEAGLIGEHPGDRVPHQLIGVLAVGGGHLLELRFDSGWEMNFHAHEGT